MTPGLVYLRPLNVVAVRVVGPYTASVATAWQLMSAYLRRSGISGDVGPSYGLLLDDPHVTIPDQCRYDACIALEPLGLHRSRQDLVVKRIPGGAYIRARHAAGDVDIERTLSKLRSELGSKNGLILDPGRSPLEIYLESPFLIPADRQRRDLCLPVTAECGLGLVAEGRRPTFGH